MRTTAVLNLKGGVAKTTTVVNMAAILAAKHKKRVLVVDADSQHNTTGFFGGVPATSSTLSEMLRRTDVNNPIHHSNFEGVDLLGADDELMELDLSQVKDNNVDVCCIKNILTKLDKEYDIVLIDCPPAFNAASAAALLAANDVVIPVKLDGFSLEGMANLMRQIQNMKKLNPKLKLAGLLPTMFYSDDEQESSLDQLRASKLPVYSPIRLQRRGKVDKTTFTKTPLIITSPNCAACVDYKRFAAEYLGEGGGRNV